MCLLILCSKGYDRFQYLLKDNETSSQAFEQTEAVHVIVHLKCRLFSASKFMEPIKEIAVFGRESFATREKIGEENNEFER